MTSAECRLNPDATIDDLLPLWTTVFGVPAEVFTPVWHSMGPSRRIVAEATVDGKLVSTVVAYSFEAHVGDGSRTGLAGVANVATLEAYRGQGLSSELLRLAKGAMSAGYSLLFTGVPKHYEKVGYERIPETEITFRATGSPMIPSSQPDQARVQAIHAEHAPRHPGCVHRDPVWWSDVTWFRMLSTRTWEGHDGYLVWENEGAYLFADHNTESLTIIEAFGNDASLASLVNGAGAWAGSHGKTNLTSRVRLPAAIETEVARPIRGEMVLPLSLDRDSVLTISASAGSGFLGIDHF